MTEDERREAVREVLAKVKPLAADYYRLTEKPLGVTGELAEYAAAECLGLTLAAARTPGFDALRGEERIQVKGRAFTAKTTAGQRMGRLRLDIECSAVILVLLNPDTLDPKEMWEASFGFVKAHIETLPPAARTRGLPVDAFRKLAKQVWPATSG